MGGEEGQYQYDNNNNKGEGDDEDDSKTTRIFIGGLGWRVTEDDIRKTFSSMGEVESVDIVRTKGRCFAYLDFLPSSDKSLAKLFSTYNGCLWKGGRLRLEKAKEHYLLRLRRDWAKDTKLAINEPVYNADAPQNMGSSEKPKKLPNFETVQLRIFFPKLNKMKSVPFSGTGKHKYSFQRIEVPSLPVHFCDCEVHSDPSHITRGKPFCDLQTATDGINEDELNIMNSVMNKLFDRKNRPQAACSELGLTKEGNNFIDLINDTLVDEREEDSATDEDNLIINMVAGGNDGIALLGSREQEKILVNQEFEEPQNSTDRPARKMHGSLRNKIVAHNKKRKSPLTQESDENDSEFSTPRRKKNLQIQTTDNFSLSQNSAWKDLVSKTGNTAFHISHVLPTLPFAKEKHPSSDDSNVPSTATKNQNLLNLGNSESQSGQSEKLIELALSPPAIPNAVLDKSTRGASWLQKSSWTQLVGDTNSSFSISQVIPHLTSGKQELLQPNGVGAASSKGSEHCNLFKSDRGKSIGGCLAVGLTNNDRITTPCASNVIALAKKDQHSADLDVEQTTTEKKLQTIGENNEVSAPILVKKNPSAPVGDFGIGETCSFMRSTASMKEWMKTKTALSGSLKKKGNEK